MGNWKGKSTLVDSCTTAPKRSIWTNEIPQIKENPKDNKGGFLAKCN